MEWVATGNAIDCSAAPDIGSGKFCRVKCKSGFGFSPQTVGPDCDTSFTLHGNGDGHLKTAYNDGDVYIGTNCRDVRIQDGSQFSNFETTYEIQMHQFTPANWDVQNYENYFQATEVKLILIKSPSPGVPPASVQCQCSASLNKNEIDSRPCPKRLEYYGNYDMKISWNVGSNGDAEDAHPPYDFGFQSQSISIVVYFE